MQLHTIKQHQLASKVLSKHDYGADHAGHPGSHLTVPIHRHHTHIHSHGMLDKRDSVCHAALLYSTIHFDSSWVWVPPWVPCQDIQHPAEFFWTHMIQHSQFAIHFTICSSKPCSTDNIITTVFAAHHTLHLAFTLMLCKCCLVLNCMRSHQL